MYQVKDFLLCQKCEGKFGVAETYVSQLIRRAEQNKFPLLDIAEQGRHISNFDFGAAYSCSAVTGLNPAMLAYFALSVVWRGAVNTWTNYDGRSFRPCPLGKYESVAGQYLLDNEPLPSSFAIWIHVLDREPGVALHTPVQKRLNDVYCTIFSVPGIRFVVLVGKQIRTEDRLLCIVNGDGNPICVFDGTRAPSDEGVLSLLKNSRQTLKFRQENNCE
jgi:hypothetical protein